MILPRIYFEARYVSVRPIAGKIKYKEQIAARFLDEARTAASVRHRNVVQILDFGIAEDGRPFMVMELLEGESLADRLMRKPPLSLAETAQTIGLTLSGLAAVHDRGIVHRDIKPENIFLTYDADGFFPKILDFGVSKDLGRDEEGARAVRTRNGVLLGTPHYMSPEQARGIRDVDPRSDIYSVGVILYEMLTGVCPFDFENVGDILMKVMSNDYPRLGSIRTELPPALVEVVERAMSLDREARYPDAREMRNALFAAIATARPQNFGITDPSGALNAELATAVVAALSRPRTPDASAGTASPSGADSPEVAGAAAAAGAATPLPAPGTKTRMRLPATSVDETIPIETHRQAELTGLLATPRLTVEIAKERRVSGVLVGLSVLLLLSLAAVELREPGKLRQLLDETVAWVREASAGLR